MTMDLLVNFLLAVAVICGVLTIMGITGDVIERRRQRRDDNDR